MSKSIKREFRAISNDQLLSLSDQDLADRNIFVVYRGRRRIIAYCLGYDEEEISVGEYICGGVPRLYSGTERRRELYEAMRNKEPHNADEVKVNHGFDELIKPVPDQPGLSEFECFECRIPKMYGSVD